MRAVTVAVGLAALLCVLGASAATAKENPANDCLVGLQGPGASPDVSVNITTLTVSCTDGDSCDADGATNGSCTFKVRGCVNIPDVSGCTLRPIKQVKFKTGNEKNLITLTPDGTQATSVCGDFVNLKADLKKNGTRAGKRTIVASATANVKPSSKNKDTDKVNFVCNPCTTSGGCVPTTTSSTAPPSTTTTTTSTTTTTTTLYTGMGVGVEVSTPANGTHFVAGEAPTVRVLLADDAGNPLSLDDLSTANLYMDGPQDESLTTTPLALLRASGDRNLGVHHYVNLKTNLDVVVSGNVVSYPLSAITDELAGTYTVSVWAVRKSDPLQQWMPLADCQIKTATAETQIVGREKCASCHQGAASGKIYMHHIDPGFSPAGNWALDSTPVRNCKACHNQDGYAAYDNKTGGADRNLNRTPDPIVRRVHGVHRGEELALPFNNDPTTGDFKDYIHVAFPADLRNCTSCHLDDRWKTAPSRQACSTCHDTAWFGDQGATPAGYVNHSGGAQANDSTCLACHADGSLAPIADAHAIPAPPLNQVDLSLTPPANGTHYVAGEMPVVTIVIHDDAGNPIDHTMVTSGNFTTAGLFVYGPRADSVPVLTNTAKFGVSKQRASVSSAIAPTGTPASWTFTSGDTLRIAVNDGAPADLVVPATTMTPTDVKNWLAGALTGVTVTSTSTAVTIKSNLQGDGSNISIYNSPVTTIMGWKAAGVTIDPDTTVARATYPINDLRALSDPLDYADDAVTRSAGNITYQLSDVASLAPGTYAAYVWSRPTSGKIAGLSKVGFAYVTFQVGTATEEPKIATNCTNCHGDNIMHIPTPTERGPHPAKFDADQCKACHDYSHPNKGDAFRNQGGTSENGWSGFGAVPISRRVHGVHFGRYLSHPEQIYSGGNPFSELIFPQDVRNCVTCHSETDDWNTKPSRLACLACHDSDSAQAHGKAMTVINDPSDPWGPTAVETCEVCHGADAPWAAAVVHNIWDPYAPPYPRNPE